LGCGLDVDYPPGHKSLHVEIAAGGAVLTEFAPGTPPRAAHFPRRNRIISGLALGVVVIEAAEDSGSLITARLALEQGREVFAVPGPIEATTSRGPHGLLKQGAKLVEMVDDIVEELLPQLERPLTSTLARGTRCSSQCNGSWRGKGEGESSVRKDLSPNELAMLELLCLEPRHLDELTEQSNLAAAEVARTLLGLELKALVNQLPGQQYCLKK